MADRATATGLFGESGPAATGAPPNRLRDPTSTADTDPIVAIRASVSANRDPCSSAMRVETISAACCTASLRSIDRIPCWNNAVSSPTRRHRHPRFGVRSRSRRCNSNALVSNQDRLLVVHHDAFDPLCCPIRARGAGAEADCGLLPRATETTALPGTPTTLAARGLTASLRNAVMKLLAEGDHGQPRVHVWSIVPRSHRGRGREGSEWSTRRRRGNLRLRVVASNHWSERPLAPHLPSSVPSPYVFPYPLSGIHASPDAGGNRVAPKLRPLASLGECNKDSAPLIPSEPSLTGTL